MKKLLTILALGALLLTSIQADKVKRAKTHKQVNKNKVRKTAVRKEVYDDHRRDENLKTAAKVAAGVAIGAAVVNSNDEPAPAE